MDGINTKTNKKRVYQCNSPSCFEDDYKSYTDALNDVIDEDGIYNIGIVAPYGSGKSSLVKTFFDKYRDRKEKMGSISLASFNKESDKELSDSEMNKVEKSILEQIVFKRSHHWKSKSRIDRIKGRIASSIVIAFFLVAFITFVLLSIMEYSKTLPFSNNKCFYIYFGISIGLGLVLAFFLLYELRINKIAFKNIEIEFDKDKNGSVLNQFIDEVINYCEETNKKYFVFEDIDRFNSVNLLLKIREINRLINENEKIKSKVTFIYCVRDGIFGSAENRAKFFDFIISPTPVLNPGNAREFIAKAFKDNNDEELGLNETAAIEMSYFIKEKRVLNNVINDYIFYKDNLKIAKKQNEKLFAMMVYKSLYSDDFTKLQSNSGLLYDTFNSYKNNAIENASTELKKSIEQKQKEIDSCETKDFSDEFLKLKQRISGIILANARTSTSVPQKYINNYTISSYGVNCDGLYVEFEGITNYYRSTNYKTLDIESFRQYLDGKTPYEVEQEIINNSRDVLTNQLLSLNESYLSLRRSSAVDLLLKGYYDAESQRKIRGCDFLFFALSNGYIDESYFEFSGKMDVALDNEFIISVLSKERTDPNKIIQNPNLVISKLSANRFLTDAVLNYSLLDALLEPQNEFKTKRSNVFDLFSKRDKNVITFIGNYFIQGKNKSEIIKEFYRKGYSQFIEDIVNVFGINDERTTSVISTIISTDNGASTFSTFFNQEKNIAKVFENAESPIEKWFTLFATPYAYIDYLKTIKASSIQNLDDLRLINNETMHAIFNKLVVDNMFRINSRNLSIISMVYFKNEAVNTDMFLKSSPDSLRNYFLSNLKELLLSIFELSTDKLTDSKEIAKTILTSTSIDDDLKIKYLERLGTKIPFVENLSSDAYVAALLNNIFEERFSIVTKIRKIQGVPFETIVDYVSSSINFFKDLLDDSSLFVDLVNSEKVSNDGVAKLCDYFNGFIEAKLIVGDNKRSIVIQKQKSTIDSSCLLSCKGMMKSIIACINLQSELVKDLPKIVSPDVYLSLINDVAVNKTVKELIVSLYYKDIFEIGKEEDIDIVKNIILNDIDTAKYSASLLSQLLKRVSDNKEKRALLEACKKHYTDKELVLIVKDNDKSLFEKLTSDPRLVKIDVTIPDNNVFYKLLEEAEIVRTKNRRSKKCNSIVERLTQIISEN